MDARHNLPKNTVLFLTLALLAIAPWQMQAQTFSTTSTSVTLSSNSTTPLQISGTSDSTAPFSFNYSVSYTSGDPQWIQFNGSCSTSGAAGTTPATVYFNVGCFAGQLSPNASHQATVTLTATGAGTGTETITVNYNSGGSGSQTLTASPSVVNMNALPGNSTTNSFNLSTTGSTAVSYTVQTPNVSWLTFTTANQSGTVTFGSSQTIGLLANSGGLANNTYSTILQITYNGSQTISVTVNFTVGSGTVNGNLTFSPSSTSFSYSTNGAQPNAQFVTVNNTGAATYNLTVQVPNSWLLVNGFQPSNGVTYGPYGFGQSISLQPINTSLGTGTYQATLTATDTNGNSGTMTIGLNVNGGSTGTFTINPNPITLSAPAGNNIAIAYVQVTPNGVSGTLSASVVSSTSSALILYSGNGQTVTSGSTVTVGIEGNPSGLSSGVYGGNLVLSVNGSTSQSFPITFTVGSGNGGGNTNSTFVGPTALNFFYEQGQQTTAGQLQQFITIAGPGSFTITGPTENSDSGFAWITAPSQVSGVSTPSLVSVGVNPTVSGITPGTYTGYYTVASGNTGASTNVNVTLTVTSGTPLLVANPGVINVTCNACATLPTQFVQIVATDGSNLPISVSSTSTGSWLSASIASTGSTTPTSIQYTITPGSLANGLYTGNIAVSGGALTNNIPVVLLVQGSSSTNGGNLTLTTSSLTFNALLNGAAPQTQTLGVSAASTTNFTASTSTTNGGSWLSVSPSGSLNTNQTLLVSANQTGLALGTYTGSISLVSGGVTQTVGVTMVVGNTTNITGNVTVSPSNLTNFSYQVGGTVPQSQTITVNSASGTAGLPFTAAATSTGNWLAVSPTTANTSATITVSLNTSALASLSPGTYSGNVTLSPTGGTVVTLPVSLTIISAPTVSATPTSLSFSYQSGGNTPSPGSISVSGSTTGLSFSATSTILSGSNWLSITPSSGTTPGTVTVNVNPSSLAAGTYNGTVTISGSGGATGTTTVNISLTVTAPLPTITAVVNAASFLASSSVSPGEIVSIGGTAIGPSSPSTLTLDSTGKVSTSIGGVTVLFNGYAAPLIYVSATQINCVVPYEIAGVISPFVQVKFLGQTSNAWSLQPAVAVPAIFTANSQGTGPGAILNGDNSFNSQKAAPKGSTIQVYMTGEGATTPAGVDGKVTTVNTSGAGPLTPAPLLPVSALVGGQPAQVTFFGEAPGLISGVLQVNIVIPATAASGNLPLSISIGTISTQQGVTVSVQ